MASLYRGLQSYLRWRSTAAKTIAQLPCSFNSSLQTRWVEVAKFREFSGSSSCNGSQTSSYPKHVWSPAGGWYAQPSNWRANTIVMGVAIAGLTALVWGVSAEKEYRTRFPEPHRFYPSRWYARPLPSTEPKKMRLIQYRWTKQVIEHDKLRKEQE